MSEDKKKMYYYGGKEKPAGEVKKNHEVTPYVVGDIQSDLDRLMNRFQRDFEDFWDTSSRFGREMTQKARASVVPFTGMPSVDLEDEGKDFRLTVDLPGFKKEDVQVEVADDVVTINAKHTQLENEQKKNYVRHERSAQTFYRRIQLPEAVRSDDSNAKLNDGILEITLPKKAPKETKKLSIT
ncbi:MAG: Hsp20/alpha crystallin family protein [Candidatus Bathyarchaeota archaeon]|nr:Hsp20/alpha crystallin family protein [Candidatus Bathyarchaeota archaeon]